MDTRIIFYFISLFVFTINSNCHKICGDQVNYSFEKEGYFTPATDSILLGDTLFFYASDSTVFKDTYTNQLIQFSGATNFGSTLGIGELIFGSDTIFGAVNHFDIIPLEGKIYSDNKHLPHKIKQLLYFEKNGHYLLSFGLIPKNKGVYVLTLSDAVNVFKPECERANIASHLQNNDHHLKYLQDLYYKNKPMAEIDKRAAYCFVVK
jgi:hypothetical protein